MRNLETLMFFHKRYNNFLASLSISDLLRMSYPLLNVFSSAEFLSVG